MCVAAAKEGCVDETLSALLARLDWLAESDAVVKDVIDEIINDEIRHAQLAWKTMAWCVSEGDNKEAMRATLSEAIRGHLATNAMLTSKKSGIEEVASNAKMLMEVLIAREIEGKEGMGIIMEEDDAIRLTVAKIADFWGQSINISKEIFPRFIIWSIKDWTFSEKVEIRFLIFNIAK